MSIEYIDPYKMRFDDDSEWQFFPATKLLSAWRIGDQVVVEKKEGKVFIV